LFAGRQVDGPDLPLPAAPADRAVGDPRPIRAEGRVHVLRRARGDLRDVPPVEVHRVKVPTPRPRRAEGDRLAVGAETGLGVVGRVAGQLRDTRAVDAL